MERQAMIIWWMMMIFGLASFVTIHVNGSSSSTDHSSHPLPHHHRIHRFSVGHYRDNLRRMNQLRASLLRRDSVVPSPSPPRPSLPPGRSSVRVYYVTSYGADPTGKADSTTALLEALSDAFHGPSEGHLMEGISNLGGAHINLEGGNYLISKPLRLPAAGVGNLMIHGGTIRASADFPEDGYLIDLSSSSSTNTTSTPSSSSSSYNYEFITLKDLMLDSNFRGGAISVINSLRTTIDNCYISHFTTTGILVQSGHETYIRNSFLGQHITAGGDRAERNFSGTAISLQGNDNAVTDVVIFSAAIGVMVSGQANTLTGVHCYNKATGFGGTGIYVRLPALTQTRIVNSYLDYTGIVAEDPVQFHVSNTFFLGDAFISLKSINGIANGVNIVDNMFTGFNKGVEIVQLDENNGNFKDINQIIVDRNNVKGMKLKSTIGKGKAEGNSSSWTIDFNSVLLFRNMINHVHYSLVAVGNSFPNHALRNISDNRVVIESDVAVPATVFVTVDQAAAAASSS